MPFFRPTLSDLRTEATTDIASALPGADALLRFSNLSVIAQAVAGFAHGFYGYLDWIARQMVPFTSTDEYLEGWAAAKGTTRKPAVAATGTAWFAGTDGSVLPAGTPLGRSDGVQYVTTASGTVAGGHVAVAIVATEKGAAGNAQTGVGFALGIAIAGISSTGVASTVITGGADIEEDEDLRSRMLERWAKPPQGGSRPDFSEWAREVPGVTRAWVKPSGMGPGTIVVYFMLDDAQAANGGFPQGTNGAATDEDRALPAAGDQLTLADHLYTKQPVSPIVYAVAPTPNTLTFSITGLSGASIALKAAVAQAIRTALLRVGQPGGKTDIDAVAAAISGVSGTSGFVITNIAATAGTISPSPAGNIISNGGALPVLGSITWL